MKTIYVHGTKKEDQVGEIRFDQELESSETQTIYHFTYNNDIKFAYDFDKLVLSAGNIYSKRKKGDKTLLSRDDGTTIELENFDNPTLNKMVNKKLLDSFINLFTRIKCEESYKYVYLTTYTGRSGIEFMPNSGKSKDVASVVCEIETNDQNELTALGRQTLNFILNKEFREWLDVFLTGEQDNTFKVCYDDKVMIVSSSLVSYVKPEAKKMEEVYLTTLEKMNTEKR